MTSGEIAAEAEGPEASEIIATMQRWLDGEPVWPYAKIIETWGPEFETFGDQMRRAVKHALDRGSIEFESDPKKYFSRMRDMYMLRDAWVTQFGFAIPCAELLDELAKAPHVIEIGAGSGYMTRLMLHRGINVTGSDPEIGLHGFVVGLYDPKQLKLTGTAAVREFSTSTVFCSWPTLNATWFYQMLRAMKVGQRLIVIREACCAEASAWSYIDNCFVEERSIELPVFTHMKDYASVLVKKTRSRLVSAR